MPTASALSLIIDITNPTKTGIIQSFQNRLPQTAPLFIRNDTETVSFRFVQPSAGSTRPWDDVNYATASTILGLGQFDQIPTSGTNTFQFGPQTTGTFSSASTSVTVASATGITNGMFVSGSGIVAGTTCTISGTTVTLSQNTTASGSGTALYFYNETGGIATGASAATVSTAVNALASVIAVGAATVSSPESGVYLFILPTGVTAGYFNGSAAGLNPSSAIVVSQVVVGAVGVSSQQVMEIFTNPFALNSTWTQFPSASATVSSLQTGAAYICTGNNTLGTNTITGLSSTTGLAVGMSISGTGIPASTVILSIVSSTVTMSNISTVAGSTASYTFATASIQQITITPGAYDGFISIATPLITTQAIANPLTGITATAIQTALNALGANYSVSGNAGGPWSVTDPTGNNTVITVNISGLIVPVGLLGTLNLSTYSMLQAFIAAGSVTEITLELECQVTPSGGGQSTPLQLSVNVSKNVINLSALLPAPAIAYLTAAQVQAIILALNAVDTLSVSAAGSSTLTPVLYNKLTTEIITAGTGAGPYTYSRTLSATNRVAGDKVCLSLSMPSSTNPTINVKNNAGSTIFMAVGTGVAGFSQRWFTFQTDWTLDA